MHDLRLKSRPIRVRFAGWESDTAALQREGWQIESWLDHASLQHSIALYHPQWDIRGISQRIPVDYANQDPFRERLGEYEQIHFGMKAMGKTIHLHAEHCVITGGFAPADCEPQVMQGRVTSLDDLCHFAPRVDPAKSIILPEEDVNALLARILEKQQPERQAYYAEQAAQERSLKRIHAQIISLQPRLVA